MKRGLVIPSSTLVFSSGATSRIGGEIPPEILRKWLLFWDEFVCPDNNVIGTGLSGDLEFLQNIGILKRNLISFSGSISTGNLAELFLAAQELTFIQKSETEPGRWAMASSEGILSNANLTGYRPCLVFDLVNSIQIPDRNVSLQDIVEFKQRRRDEFEAFHQYMSDIYLKIIASGDVPRARTFELEKLQRGIADINRTVEESFASRCITGLRTALDRSLIDMLSVGFGAAALAPQINFPAVNVGVFSAFAVFCYKGIKVGSQSVKTQPLTYIASAVTKL